MLRAVPLLLLFLVLITGNTLWYRLGDHPEHWDSAIHLSESLNANRIGLDSSRSTLHQMLNVSWYYPPFVSYASVVMYGLLGESEFAGFQVMTLFFALLILCVYLIGEELFGMQEGVVAASLLAACPLVIRYSHMFMLDLPLASMVALSVYLLIRTDSFRRTITSLGFGLALGAGMLTKWTFPLFLLGPFVHVAFSALRKSPDRRRRLINCGISLLAGSSIAAPWYLVHALQILSSRGGELVRGEEAFAGSIWYYLGIMPEEVSWFLTPLFIGGVLVCLAKYQSRILIPVLSFAGGYVLLTLIGFKQPRFSLPLLVPISVLASNGLVSWIHDDSASTSLKRILTAALVVVPLIQYLVVSFVPPGTSLAERLSRPFLSSSIEKVDGPIRADWKQDSIAATIDRDREERGRKRAVVRVIPDYVFFNNATITYEVKLRRYPVIVLGTTGFPLFTDYVLLKTGNTGDDSVDRDRLRNEILSEASGPSGMYGIMHRWRLPDGSEGILLRVEPRPVAGITVKILAEKLRLHADQFLGKYLLPVRGYELKVDTGDSDETLKGFAKGINVIAGEGRFGDFTFNPVGLSVENVRLAITDLRFDPGKLAMADTLLLVSIGGLSVESFTIGAGALRRYAQESSGGNIVIDSLSILRGVIHFEGSLRGYDPRIRFDLRLYSFGHENIRLSFESLSIGIVPIPSLLVNIMTSPYNPVLTGLDALSNVTIGTLSLEDDRISIGR